jgi:glucokinase
MFLAFDLGGTRIKAARVDPARLRPEGLTTAPTPPQASEALARVRELGAALLAGHTCTGVGLAVPGLVDEPGIVAALPGKLPGLVGFDLPHFLTKAFCAPPVVANDATAYAVGEANHGAGRGFHRVLVVTIGTGVGVGVVQAATPISTGRAGGGVLGGHVPISDAEPQLLDSNGRSGTVEALCAARRLVDFAALEGSQVDTVEALHAAHASGDRAARRAVLRYRGHLVRALTALCHAHGPDAVVLGGGPVAPGNPLLPGLQDEVNARLWEGYRIELRAAELGDAAALVGLVGLHAARYGAGR